MAITFHFAFEEAIASTIDDKTMSNNSLNSIHISPKQWRSQLEIMVPPCRAEGATPLGGFGGMRPRENFQM